MLGAIILLSFFIRYSLKTVNCCWPTSIKFVIPVSKASPSLNPITVSSPENPCTLPFEIIAVFGNSTISPPITAKSSRGF